MPFLFKQFQNRFRFSTEPLREDFPITSLEGLQHAVELSFFQSF